MNIVDRVRGLLYSLDIRPGEKTILAAVSGGKDSVAMLHILATLGYDVIPFHILLSEHESHLERAETVKKVSKLLGLEPVIVRLKDYLGFDILEVAELDNSRRVCSDCGIAKRRIMNRYAIEHGIPIIATGHTLEDSLMFFIKNLMSGHIELVPKVKPYREGVPGIMAAKLKPLFYISERETAEYVKRNYLPVAKKRCPFEKTDAKRFALKELMRKFDELYAGGLKGLVKGMIRFIKTYCPQEREEVLNRCKICGGPTSPDREICTFCALKRRLEEKARKNENEKTSK